MAHAAAIYNVRVHPIRKPNEPLPLGDIDKSGTRLIDVINDIFSSGEFKQFSDSAERSVTCLETEIVGDDEIRAMFSHGQTGMVADILDENEELRFEQRPEHTHQLRCGSVFWLDPNETEGWWAVHVNNGRSGQGLISKLLREQFKEKQEGLIMKISPSVPTDALVAAIDAGHLDAVQLIRHITPKDRAEGSVDRWMDAKGEAKLEVKLTAKDHYLRSDLVAKYLKDKDAKHFGEIVSFSGLSFTEAKVAVTLESGRKRTFNVREPDHGHPLTESIILDLEPSDADVYKALRSVLQEIA